MGRLRVLTLLVALVAITVAAAPAQAKKGGKPKTPNPVIFVHGQFGSADQFETDAMRFTSNGFPQGRLFVYEYDTSIQSNDGVIEGLDAFIASVKAQTGASQVDVLAHSRGTTVMHSYLSTPERAAQVAHYVNFDGRTSDAPPGGVPTLAVWGEGDPTRAIVGAQNVYYPEKSHTEATTSREAFAEVYRFLLGRSPKTTKVVPEKPNKVTVAGRALEFPNNTAIVGATLQVFEVDAATGQRKGAPIYTQAIAADGNWGPVKVNGKKHYEFAISEPGNRTLHNYPEPFEHDDHFYRVLNSPLLEPFIESGPSHTAITVRRMLEWRGDQDPAGNDSLSLNGVNVINPAIAPRARRVLAIFNFDKNSDGVTDTSTPLEPFASISFLSGVDLFMPASPAATGTIAVTETMRQTGHVETINVPNWPSSEGVVSVLFRDYVAKKYKKPKKKKK
jgi:Lipase C-terminal domain/Lipase (class 2)